MDYKLRRILGNSAIYIVLIIVAIGVLFPIWTAINISFLDDTQVSSFPPLLVPTHFSLSNYARALEQAPLLRYLFNSVAQSTLVMLGQLITACLAAYAFAFIEFKWRNVLFLVFLATLMIPWEATIIPNYLLIKKLKWDNTFQGLAVPFMATGFGTFLLRQFFLKIPRELKDAAVIDGCSSFRFLINNCAAAGAPGFGHPGGVQLFADV